LSAGSLGIVKTNTRVVNSTISHNLAQSDGANSSSVTDGAGVYSLDPNAKFQFDTITANTAKALHATQAHGGGILKDPAYGGTTFLEGTILAGNVAAHGPNCAGSVTSSGYNLIGSTVGCPLKKKPTDRTGTPAKKLKLGKLAGNGGPTETIALSAGSPALDRVPRKICRAIASTDQRGVRRPQGKHPAKAKCDEGAYERKVKK
jgi:hypothetical protein